MSEHDDLDAVVRHAFGHALVGGHHAAAEILVLTLDGKRAAAVPDPIGKLRRRVLAQPGDEEVQNLLVLHRIAIRRVGHENVMTLGQLLRRMACYLLHDCLERSAMTCSQLIRIRVQSASTSIHN